MISVAYDFDGTLVDIKTRQMGLLDAICKSFGVEINQDRIWRQKREGFNNVAALREQNIEGDLAFNLDKIWRSEIESQFWLTLDKKIAKRTNEVRMLRNWNCKTYLISARKHPHNLFQQLEALDLTNDFDEVIRVNPASKVTEKAHFLKVLGIDLFIGDTEADYSSSQLANVKFHGVTTGQRSLKFLRDTGIRNIDLVIEYPLNFKNSDSGR